jgi:hypothetical protein
LFYLKYLEYENPDLRFDVLVCLRPVTVVREYLVIYRKCLKDKDQRIRELALKKLDEEGGSCLLELKNEIEVLIHDPNMEVKRAALKILKKVTRK